MRQLTECFERLWQLQEIMNLKSIHQTTSEGDEKLRYELLHRFGQIQKDNKLDTKNLADLWKFTLKFDHQVKKCHKIPSSSSEYYSFRSLNFIFIHQ